MNKYLFLDIDGVLNSERSALAQGRFVHANRVKQDIIQGTPIEAGWCERSVACLRAAQEASGFSIVISSTWRYTMGTRDFHLVFDRYGWDTRGIVIGKTDQDSGCRGDQIDRWLRCEDSPYTYCILDDSSDMLEAQLLHFVRIDYREGLVEADVERILRTLTRVVSE